MWGIMYWVSGLKVLYSRLRKSSVVFSMCLPVFLHPWRSCDCYTFISFMPVTCSAELLTICCSISGSKNAVNMDYLTHIRDSVVGPLIKEGLDGVTATLHVMQSYYLLREDIESLTELSSWPNQKDPMSHVESKVTHNCSSVIMYPALMFYGLMFIQIIFNKAFWNDLVKHIFPLHRSLVVQIFLRTLVPV